MSLQTNIGDQPLARQMWHPFVILTFAGFFLLGVMLGYAMRFFQAPGVDSVDVGFARDMSEHHRQAVEMSTLLYNNTDDEALRILAYDILTTQQAQIGIMGGWLDAWGHAWGTSQPRMRWMGMAVDGLMPGMATQAELNALSAAQGLEAEILFLQLMIPHHQSGVAMADAAAENAQNDYVSNLARLMGDAQTAEIEYMQRLLEERGVEPMPEMEMEMEVDS